MAGMALLREAMRGKIAVINFQRERRDGGGVDASAVAAPDRVGVPTASVRAFQALTLQQLLLEGGAPRLPRFILTGEESQRGIVPVIKVRLAFLGKLLHDGRRGFLVRGLRI